MVPTVVEESVYKTGLPFMPQIIGFSLLRKYKIPQLESFNSTNDPLHGVPFEIMRQAFLITSKSSTKVLFNKLRLNSIFLV